MLLLLLSHLQRVRLKMLLLEPRRHHNKVQRNNRVQQSLQIQHYNTLQGSEEGGVLISRTHQKPHMFMVFFLASQYIGVSAVGSEQSFRDSGVNYLDRPPHGQKAHMFGLQARLVLENAISPGSRCRNTGKSCSFLVRGCYGGRHQRRGGKTSSDTTTAIRVEKKTT